MQKYKTIKNKHKKITTIITVMILLCGCKNDNKITSDISKAKTDQPIMQDAIMQDERELWLNNKSINSDYQGEIIFESGVINKSFVQAQSTYDNSGKLYKFYTRSGRLVTNPKGYTGNDVYIWTNWKDMSYDYNIEGGSVFMDYRNTLNDQNIIIYGHHFSEGAGNDPERNKAFTPLENALKINNVDDYRNIKLILDNETRYYELAYVYKYDATKELYIDNCQYYRTNYNFDEFNNLIEENYYQNYIDTLEKIKLYDTGVKLNTDDKTLTLQTCISGHDGELFEICVYRFVKADEYPIYIVSEQPIR